MYNKDSKYSKRRKCVYCHVTGHESASCLCRQGKHFCNIRIYEGSESSWSLDGETMAMAADVIEIESSDKYTFCKMFNEIA